MSLPNKDIRKRERRIETEKKNSRDEREIILI